MRTGLSYLGFDELMGHWDTFSPDPPPHRFKMLACAMLTSQILVSDSFFPSGCFWFDDSSDGKEIGSGAKWGPTVKGPEVDPSSVSKK